MSAITFRVFYPGGDTAFKCLSNSPFSEMAYALYKRNGYQTWSGKWFFGDYEIELEDFFLTVSEIGIFENSELKYEP